MYKKILVPLDGSALAEKVLPHAQALAKSEGAEIVLLRVPVIRNTAFVAQDPTIISITIKDIIDETKKYIDTKVSKLRNEGNEVTGLTRSGSVPETILVAAEETHADVIAMSTHGRIGLSRWIKGSVAGKVVHDSHVPVILIHPN